MLTTLLSFLLACAIVFYTYSNSKMKRMMKHSEKIPGPPYIPLIGTSVIWNLKLTDAFNLLKYLHATYGLIVRVWVADKLLIGISDPKYMEIVYSSTKEMKKAYLYSFAGPWLGEGLLTSNGEKWKKHRKLLTPAFHFTILENFIEGFNNTGKTLVKKLSKHVNGSEFEIAPYISLAALDNICETAMGVSINAQENEDSEYVRAVREQSDIIFERIVKPWLHPEFIFNLSSHGRRQKKTLQILHGLTRSVIKQRKLEMKNTANGHVTDEFGRKRRLAFLDLLLEASDNGKVLTEDEIAEEVDTFMFEGHDTTTSAMIFTLWHLSRYPDVQDKAVQELKEMFGDTDREETLQDLQNMKYLEMVIKESLRLFPSVSLSGRSIQEDVDVGDYVIPEGTDLVFLPFFLHRNENYFPDPEKFDPERFSPENSAGRHPYAYVPFAAGPRNCIGQKFAMLEIKSTVSTILRHYVLEKSDSEPNMELYVDIVLKTRDPLHIKIKPRHAITT